MRRHLGARTPWFAVIALIAGLSLGRAARGGGISEIVSFGDSLSDVGNVYLATGGTQPAPPADYYQGHFSNGPIWLEYLAHDLGLAAPTPSLAGGTDYAFGGAETGTSGLSTLGAPNIGTQIATYLGSNTPNAGQLFTIWGGANDFLLGNQTDYTVPAANIAHEITALANAGAKQFLIGNLPLLGELPATSGLTAAQRQGLDQLTLAFNGLLASESALLAQNLGIDVHILNVQGLVQSAMADPGAYGFTNVTDPGINSSLEGNGHLFWDDEHPTTGAHQFIGALAAQSVPEPTSLVLLGTALCGLAAWRATRGRTGRGQRV